MRLNLYCCQAVRHKLKKGVKHTKMHFYPLFELVSEHIIIGCATSITFASIYPTHPRTNPWNFCEKYWELMGQENDILFSFFVSGYWVFQKKKIFLIFPNEKSPITMAFKRGSVYFCTMNGFFRILKKALSELICTRLYKSLKAL